MDEHELPRTMPRNRLLTLMSDHAFGLVKRSLEPVSLPTRTKLVEAGKPTRWMYFPETGVASVISQSSRAWQEIGLFGQEGVGSCAGLLSPNLAPYTVIMQIEGCGHRIAADELARAVEACPELRSIMMRYMYAFGIQVAQTAVANVQCNITERLARWILMIADRLDRPTIHITHEFLAGMLGVGRTGVTLALHDLEDAGLIGTGRKRIDLLDRKGLEQLTSGFYGFAEREYDRLVTHAPAPATAAPRVQLVAR